MENPPDITPARRCLQAPGVGIDFGPIDVYQLVVLLCRLLTGESAEAFLGTQGDVWDTQKDMLLALIGAVSSLLLLARWHDRQLATLASKRGI